MKCYTCGETMKCYDDVNQEGLKIDWLLCHKCGSWAQIELMKNGHISEVLWKRDKPKKE